MFSSVVLIRTRAATITCAWTAPFAVPVGMFRPNTLFSNGISTIGMVTSTAVIVRTPANRYTHPVNQE